MATRKVLVPYPVLKDGLAELYNRGYEVFYPEDYYPKRQDILDILPKYDALISCGFQANAEAVARMDNVKIMSTYGVGYDNVALKEMTERGILVCNLPDVVTESTAEFGMGLMLAVMRRISVTDQKLRILPELRWGPIANLGHGLNGKRLGILGMGRIGKAVARRAKAFLMDVTYHNRHQLPAEVEAEYSATYVPTADQLFRESDVVIINLPLTDSTRQSIGMEQFEMMKRTAYFINVGRGPIVREKELIEALEKGVIAGAGLDVFEHEPNIPAALRGMPNVVLGAHMATATYETRSEMVRLACKNIIDYLEYGQHPNLVNPEVLANKRPL